MSILVTGGAGYIGSHMVYRLADAGEDVIVLDNLVTGFDWLVDPRARLIVGNAGDTELLAEIFADNAIDAIIHFAGSVVVPESVANPLKYYANNTGTTRNLLEAAVKAEIDKVIFSSTAAVYGMTGLDPVSEDTPLNPISPYGRSKLMSEMMIADIAAAHPIRFGILRYFNVAGADPLGRTGQATANATHLIKLACRTALGLRPAMDIYGTDYPTPDGTCLRDFIHVSDLVAAHGLLLVHLRGGGQSVTLNCGYGNGYSVREVIDMVKKISGSAFAETVLDRRAGDPASVVAATDRIHSVLDWQPEFNDLETIVRSALEWERRHEGLDQAPSLVRAS